LSRRRFGPRSRLRWYQGEDLNWANPIFRSGSECATTAVGLGWRLLRDANRQGQDAVRQAVRFLPWRCAGWKRDRAPLVGRRLPGQLERAEPRRSLRENPDHHARGSTGQTKPRTERRYFGVLAHVQRFSSGSERAPLQCPAVASHSIRSREAEMTLDRSFRREAGSYSPVPRSLNSSPSR
jgi:hypothetical protein